MSVTSLGNGNFSYENEEYPASKFNVMVSVSDASHASEIYDLAMGLGFAVENNKGSQTELSVNRAGTSVYRGEYREIVVDGADGLLATLQSLSA